MNRNLLTNIEPAMRKIVIEQFGGPDVLQLTQADDPTPGPQDMLVRVHAAGVNFLDIYQRQGLYSQSDLPFTPGLEGAGTVLSVGSGVTSLHSGDRVAWISQIGSYADLLVLPAERAIPLPATLDIAANPASGLLFQAVTAQYLSTEFRTIRPGVTALVHAAAGGVGQLLTQWLSHLGARVIATASSPEKLAIAKPAGAEILVNYKDSSFLEAVRSETDGRGVDIAFDSVGKTTFADTVEALAPRGTAVLYGTASGNPPLLDPAQLITGSRRVAAGELFEHINDPKELQTRARAVLDAISAGWLTLSPGRQYSLEQAAQAQQDLESRASDGKLLLVPDAVQGQS